MSLNAIPLDILIDSILPSLPPDALGNLAQTDKDFYALVQGPAGESVWRRKAEEDFHFPTANTGRRSGWRELYRRLLKQSCYIWGQNSNGRLGISADDHSSKRHLIQGGLPLPTRLPLSATVVGLEAGGYSFHALTSSGAIISWGTMDGDNWARGGALSHVRACAYTPFELPASKTGALGEVVQVQAGRKHVVVRNTKGEVWEYRSFGRAYQVVDATDSWGPTSDPANRVVAVEAGWNHSAVLTASGAAFIWWEPGPVPIARLATEAGEDSLSSPSTQGVTFSLPIDTTRLPPLTNPRRAALRVNAPAVDKIVSLASGVDFVIALTEQSKLYYLDISPVDIPNQPLTFHGGEDAEDSPERGRASCARLEAAFLSGERGWVLMERFCDMQEVGKLEVWDAHGLSKPAFDTKITAISAHFHSFVVYSVPDTSSGDSIVLMGDDFWTPGTLPKVIPELQSKSVIKVAQGDYHYIALTSSGHIYSWGGYSAGALGLGHPQLLDTPLSAPHPPCPPPSDAATTPSTTAPYPMPSINPVRGNIFPGFTRSVPRSSLPAAPDHVDVPTLIRFAGEDAPSPSSPSSSTDADAPARTSGKFVFAVTASGWHSGCLAVELSTSPDPLEEPEPKETTAAREFDAEHAAQAGAGRGQGTLLPFGHSGIHYRIGYPGRGAMRGAHQPPVVRRPEE